MATSQFPSRFLSVGVAAAAAAALLAGCSGSQALNPSPVAGSSSVTSHSPVLGPDVKGHCQAHGGVRVTPCTVDFTVSSPSPVTVSVRVPKDKKGVLTETDNCNGASGVATVTQGTGDEWVVSPGSMAGSCTATFTLTGRNKHGKVLGYANLNITNSI